MATVSVTFSNPDEGAIGPSHLGTGEDRLLTQPATRMTPNPEAAISGPGT